MKAQAQMKWGKYLQLFSNENRNRPTRIAVYEGEPGSMLDYWLEDGLPLSDIDVDPDGSTGPQVQIMLDNGPTAPANLTHRVIGARFVKITLSVTGEADGLEIQNSNGETTVVQFENGVLGD